MSTPRRDIPALLAGLPDIVRAWLPTQRWFAGKAHPIDNIEVEDLFALDDDAEWNVAVLAVRQNQAAVLRDARYCVAIGVGAPAGNASTLGHLGSQAVVDATASSQFLHRLLSGLATSARIAGCRGGVLAYGDASPSARELAGKPESAFPRAAPVGAEQSNTSIRLGGTHVFKLLRRLESGEHPELEIGRFLVDVGFHRTPPLEGSLTYVPNRGSATTIGLLQGWVQSVGDGWGDMVAALSEAATDPSVVLELDRRVVALGSATAELHVAMASESAATAFAPEPITEADLLLWQQSFEEQRERTLALIERGSTVWPSPAGELCNRILRSRDGARDRLDAPPGTSPSGIAKIRIHGDLHLGQTLWTERGYVILDFEGEPGKPLQERRRKQMVLRDLAGLLRSLDYAAATAFAATGDERVHRAIGPLRRTLIATYRDTLACAPIRLVPASPGDFAAWLAHFEREKALYEVEYEANNRPGWVAIPLATLAGDASEQN